MAADKPVLATLSDPDGRAVILRAEIWEDKITRDHPELREHLEQVLATVTDPDHVEPDPARAAAPLLPSARRPESLAAGGRKL